MKLINRIYRVDLYEDDVKLLADLLEDRFRKESATLDSAPGDGATPAQVEQLKDKHWKTRKLRNDIGALINRSYMGADA